VRAEVAAERDEALGFVEGARAEVDQIRGMLEAERVEFEQARSAERSELDRAWSELRKEQEALREERDRASAAARDQQLVALDLQRQVAAMALQPPPAPSPYAAQAYALPPGPPPYYAQTPAGMPPPPMEAPSPSGAMSAPPPGASSGAFALYAIGGLERANLPLNSAEVLELQSGGAAQWRALPSLGVRRGYLGTAILNSNGAIYAVGGSDGQSTLDTVEEFSTQQNRWREVAPMPTRRIWLGCAAVGNLVIAAGGYDGHEYLNTVEAFDPTKNVPSGEWRSCQSMSMGRSTLGLGSMSGTIYAVGGFVAPNYLSTVEAYDPNANQWWGVHPLKQPRRDLGVAALDNHMLVAIGGYDGHSYLSVCEGYDPRAGNGWMPLAPMRVPRQLLGAASAGGYLYALGGFDGKNTSTVVEQYDPRMNAWMDLPPLSAARLGLGACAM